MNVDAILNHLSTISYFLLWKYAKETGDKETEREAASAFQISIQSNIELREEGLLDDYFGETEATE